MYASPPPRPAPPGSPLPTHTHTPSLPFASFLLSLTTLLHSMGEISCPMLHGHGRVVLQNLSKHHALLHRRPKLENAIILFPILGAGDGWVRRKPVQDVPQAHVPGIPCRPQAHGQAHLPRRDNAERCVLSFIKAQPSCVTSHCSNSATLHTYDG